MSDDCYSARFDEAAAFVIAAFRSKRRKVSNVPYVTHLLAVCALVGEAGGDEDQMIAALLHDWLEDIDGARLETIEARFGERVATLVAGLSDVGARAPGEPKPPWQERKDAYLVHLRTAGHDLKLISCADKLHNCLSIRADHRVHRNAVFDRFNASQAGTLWYYGEVCAALAEGWTHPLLDRLKAEVVAMTAEATLAGG